MKVEVLSLRGVEYFGDSESLNLKTMNGEITILDNHRPLISLLTKGIAHITQPGGKKRDIDINSGFLEVNSDNSVSVLIH